MIKAKRERGGKVMEGSFTEKQWNAGIPQKAGWKKETDFKLSAEKVEAQTGRENVNVALQEQLLAKDNKISTLESQLETAHAAISEMEAKIVVLEANQKKTPGRKTVEA